jgi:hypothetical protein
MSKQKKQNASEPPARTAADKQMEETMETPTEVAQAFAIARAKADTNGGKEMSATRNGWLDVDILGMRETLARKGKAFVVFELLQNSWDTDATEVDITLTKPRDGMSTLRCKDNAPDGYKDLSHAHTLYARSAKKVDPEARGRFNIGEKHVLVVCDEARIKSTSGTIIFDGDGTRRSGSTKTRAGSEFEGRMPLEQSEWDEIAKQVLTVIPPIPTKFNNQLVPSRAPMRTFKATLPTEVADESTKGVLRPRMRECEVRLYEVRPGEVAHVYERGIPVTDIRTPSHVDVQQKIPQTLERDGITPSYEKVLYAAVWNEMHESITTADDASEPWVSIALESGKLKVEAVKSIVETRFGEDAVSYDPSDKRSNKEAAAKGSKVVHGGAFSKKEWEEIRKAEALKPAGQVFPTDLDLALGNIVDPKDYDDDLQRFVKLIKDVSPLLISLDLTVRVIDEDDDKITGCTQWRPNSYIFTINIAHQDTSNWQENYALMVHEFAHFQLQENDHLAHGFHVSVNRIAAMLVQVALAEPKLFKGIPQPMPKPLSKSAAHCEEAAA